LDEQKAEVNKHYQQQKLENKAEKEKIGSTVKTAE